MKVKICGITDLHMAQIAVKAGADALGFVFANSKREITVEHAQQIISKLPETIMKVGVFVDEEKERIEEIVQAAHLTHVQLHGNETPDFAHSFSIPIIKAIGVKTREDMMKLHEFRCEYILLDSPNGKYAGGNGTQFNWRLINGMLPSNKKIILAGGLHEGNVIEAIQMVRPVMVDVSSGVETDGRKDGVKIRDFIAKAKSIEEDLL